MEVTLIQLLAITFLGLVSIVGGYVYFFLKVMQSDPREIEFREKHGYDYGLAPSQKEYSKGITKKSKELSEPSDT